MSSRAGRDFEIAVPSLGRSVLAKLCFMEKRLACLAAPVQISACPLPLAKLSSTHFQASQARRVLIPQDMLRSSSMCESWRIWEKSHFHQRDLTRRAEDEDLLKSLNSI